jgi:hypothetical protein
VHGERSCTHLHDKLDGTNEEAEELEDQVLLLLLHLVQPETFPTLGDFVGRQTSASISLQQLFGHGLCAARLGFLLLFEIGGGVLRLELLDECVHVLFFLVVIIRLRRLLRRVVLEALLLVELAARHIVAEMVGWSRHDRQFVRSRLLFSNGDGRITSVVVDGNVVSYEV